MISRCVVFFILLERNGGVERGADAGPGTDYRSI